MFTMMVMRGMRAEGVASRLWRLSRSERVDE